MTTISVTPTHVATALAAFDGIVAVNDDNEVWSGPSREIDAVLSDGAARVVFSHDAVVNAVQLGWSARTEWDDPDVLTADILNFLANRFE